MSKEFYFTLKMAKSRGYTAEIITDPDYPDDLALLENSPAQAESLLHNQEQAAGGIASM